MPARQQARRRPTGRARPNRSAPRPVQRAPRGAEPNALQQRLGNRGAQALMSQAPMAANRAAAPRPPVATAATSPIPTPAVAAPAAPVAAAAAPVALATQIASPVAVAAAPLALEESAQVVMDEAREQVGGLVSEAGGDEGATAEGGATRTAVASAAVAVGGAATAPAARGGGGAVAASGGEAPAAIEAVSAGGEQQAGEADEGGIATASGGGGGGGGGNIELLMPPPPEGLSEADQGRLSVVAASAGRAASAQEQLPTASAGVASAREAVDEPPEETAARAEGELASELAVAPAPSPGIESFCTRMREVIHSRQPPDEESLASSRPRQEAEAAGRELETTVEGDVDNVESGYDSLKETPEGTPQQVGTGLSTPPTAVETPGIGAERAVPDPVPDENVSLDADVEASAAAMDEAGMETESAQLAQSGPVAEARGAQDELGALAETGPEQVLAEQAAAQANASADMAALQAQALEALRASRAGSANTLGTQQTGVVGSEEQMRAQISVRATAIFSAAQDQVRTQLEPLVPTAMARWNAEIAVLSTRFEADLRQVREWLDERYSGAGGAVLEFFEDIVGKPGWVTRAYNDAEERFGDGVCDLLREISTQINAVIQTCEEIIANANRDIDDLFSNNLPAELQEWADGERASFAAQLDSLHQEVISTRDDLTQNLIDSAGNAVQEVRERIHELRLEAGGLVGRVVDAIERFAENPAKFILEALLELVGIPPASFWALVNQIESVINDIADDPLNFANNMAAALGQGFRQFFDNFVDHVVGGFFDWLFSGLGSVGVNIPGDFSLKSIITFFLELMGITWPRIRELLARHIGEENVALIEKAYELIAALIEQGPEGIFEMIKEQLNPENILNMVIDAAIDFMIQALITAVTPRVIAMFNPAGAIIQAIEVIFRILKWVFDNAARIFSLIETVVNGAAELIAGNIGGMASAVEGALARLIPPVIDFLAGFLGMGDLPDQIADTIRGFQEWVMGILERVITWLAERGRALLSALGLGGEEDDTPESGAEEGDGEIGKKVDFGAHEHWLRVSGNTVVAMVASDGPGPVDAQLSEFERLARQHEFETAISLIAQARQQLTQVQSKGDTAAQEKSQAESNPEDSTQAQEFVDADTQAEAAQETLGQLLAQLFEILQAQEVPDIVEVLEENRRWKVKNPIRVQFNVRNKYDPADYRGQLLDQQNGVNRLTLAEWATNRASYEHRKITTGTGRHEVGGDFQRAAHPHYRQARLLELRTSIAAAEPDLPPDIVHEMADQQMQQELPRGQHALHGPDMIAGGYAERITGLGTGGINSSIGAQWRYAPRKDFTQQAGSTSETVTEKEEPSTRIGILTREVARLPLEESQRLITQMNVEFVPNFLNE